MEARDAGLESPGLMRPGPSILSPNGIIANCPLADKNVRGTAIRVFLTHPLDLQLASFTGLSLAGRSDYTLRAKVPFAGIRLVGGTVGRVGGETLAITRSPGEVLSPGASFDGISTWSRGQDHKVCWPAARRALLNRHGQQSAKAR